MADPQHVAKLNEGVSAWNQWRAHSRGRVDLSGVDLHERDLTGVDFGVRRTISDPSGSWFIEQRLSVVDLRDANLAGAKLTSARLNEANLVRATLARCGLVEAALTRANLEGANLTEACLAFASLESTNLARAKMHKTILRGSLFINTYLSEVEGLDTCRHDGPSVVDLWTLLRYPSLPQTFLRGCGVTDTMIHYLGSLVKEAIQFHSCFISYSTKDQEFADRLYADLQNNGVRCWFAPRDAQGGKKLHDQIVDAIQFQDRLLLILSKDSMSSEWVRNEIFHARQRERKEKRRVLFPIRLVSYNAIQDWKSDASPEIAEYFIPDFRRWKDHDAYQTALERLLRDLKTETSAG